MKNQINPRRLSKFLSLVLRHKPETINLNLDENGWASMTDLLAKLNAHGKHVNYADIEAVVKNNDKQRFKLDAEKQRIRANQGHSIAVELDLQPVQPPAFLYHGTATKSLASIQKTGLEKRSRQHVHLSADLETASKVGKRHGQLVVLTVNSEQMYKDGYSFYFSENKVWLTDVVPVQYLSGF